MILRLGSEGPEVTDLAVRLALAGYRVPYTEGIVRFCTTMDRCVRAYQEDRGLTVDGAVTYQGGQAWPRLAAEPVTETRPDGSPRAARLSKGLATLYDAERGRMRPEYRSSWLHEWEDMENGLREDFVIPHSSDGSGKHGATCGHAAWILTSWWMRAMHPEKGVFPTWRTGRGPTSSMPKRFLPLAPVAGIMYGGELHRGLAEYALPKFKVKDLTELQAVAQHQWFVCQKDSGHVIVCVNIGLYMGCIDPRTGLPAVPGLYRLAADGSSKTIGKPWTWRRVRPGEVGPWSCFGFADLPDSGEVTWGPLAGSPDLPLVME